MGLKGCKLVRIPTEVKQVVLCCKAHSQRETSFCVYLNALYGGIPNAQQNAKEEGSAAEGTQNPED